MFHRQSVVFVGLCIGVGLIGVLGGILPLVSDAEENWGLDLLYLLRGPVPPPTDVVLVAIDGESAAALNLPLDPHQWPRKLHSRLLAQLMRRQAAVVAFDLLFQAPQNVADDQALAVAMRGAGNVVLAQAIDRQILPFTDPDGGQAARMTMERIVSAIPLLADAAIGQAPFPLPKIPIKLNQFWCFHGASGNLPTLPVVAFHVYVNEVFLDFIHLMAEVDGHLKAALAMPAGEAVDLSTMVRMIRPLRDRFQEDADLASKALERLAGYRSDDVSPRTRRLMRSLIDLYGSGNSRYLNFYGPPGAIRTLSYHRLVNSHERGADLVDSAFPEGAAVLVGQTDSNWIKTHDGFYTAFSGASGNDISGVEIAATALANLLEGKGVYPLGLAARLIVLTGWSILAVAVSLYTGTVSSVIGLVLLSGVYFCAAFSRFQAVGVWYPLLVPILLQTPAAFVAGLMVKYRKASTERRNIRQALGYYLPDDVVDQLSANLKSLNLGGQVFYGVCLFTDAQNYTTLSERMDLDSLTDLMNSYYEAIFGPIKANGGLVLQVVGDSVMALWTASHVKEEIKQAACMAAMQICAAVARFNRKVGAHAMPTRIGIHAGDMLLGNIGAMDHFEYRPVGDIVNTASRLEGLNKFLGTQVLVSRDAIGQVNGFMDRPVGGFVLKGKSRAVQVHELLALESSAGDEITAVHRLFASGLVAFQEGRWDDANHLFHQVLRIEPTDGPSLFYIEQCRHHKHAPPAGNWGGVVRVDRK